MIPFRSHSCRWVLRNAVLLVCFGCATGCDEDQDPPQPPPPPTDYRDVTLGVFSGRAYYRTSYFGITTDSVNWISDAVVSLDASDDSSIVISNLDTFTLEVDTTFAGAFAEAPLPMGQLIFSWGKFRTVADTMFFEFHGSSPIDGVLREYVFDGFRL